MFDLELPDNGGGVVGHEELLQMVDDHLVHAVGAVGRGHGIRKLFARRDVPDDGLFDAGEELGAILKCVRTVKAGYCDSVNVNSL